MVAPIIDKTGSNGQAFSHPTSAAAGLGAAERAHLAVEALAGSEPITGLAGRHEVSRKFVYQQKAKASEALQQAFAPSSACGGVGGRGARCSVSLAGRAAGWASCSRGAAAASCLKLRDASEVEPLSPRCRRPVPVGLSCTSADTPDPCPECPENRPCGSPGRAIPFVGLPARGQDVSRRVRCPPAGIRRCRRAGTVGGP